MTSASSGRVATITPSVGSAGTISSAESHSAGGTTISTTPEPKSTNHPSGSRTDIHYPAINVHPSKIYESKKNKKIVRLLTVLAYMFAVSLAAMVLSLYYLFLWDPYMQPAGNRSFTETMGLSTDTNAVSNASDEAGVTLTPLVPASQRQFISILTTKRPNIAFPYNINDLQNSSLNIANGKLPQSNEFHEPLNETTHASNKNHSSVASWLIPFINNTTKLASEGMLIDVSNDTALEMATAKKEIYRLEVSEIERQSGDKVSNVSNVSNVTESQSNGTNPTLIPP
ncbi:hypothetical protein B4U79_13517 [Dinothrombium tinctorium]|uniref:Transmembrane protein INAFM2 n=1 Tax=Dinothrombium tinctorium TaxID=1965070 RepID=A0A3S3S191_9ACAR|nr:hypothetical protein B4U79_13517 [Dinothrombium tinctorium]